jgi:hypothetical protein
LNVKKFYGTKYDAFPETLNRQIELDITGDSQLDVVSPRTVDLFNTFPLEETQFPPYFRNALSGLNTNMIRLGIFKFKNIFKQNISYPIACS